MNGYTIYCTKEQTKKALELGAPIDILPNYAEYRMFPLVKCKDGNERPCIFPTAEQMIGWLEEQGIWIHFCKPNQRPELLSFSISNIKEPFRRVFVGGEYNSRKKATLSAIDRALDCLTKIKNDYD